MCSPKMYKVQFPSGAERMEFRKFASAIKGLVRETYQPHVSIDLSEVPELNAEAIDALLECVERVEGVDGAVSITGASPEALIILELTRITSVVEAINVSAAEKPAECIATVSERDSSGNQQLAA